MKKLIGNSLSTRFTTILTVVMAGFFLLFSAIITIHNIGSIKSQLDKRLSDLSSLAQSSLSSALWQYNQTRINDFVDALFLFEDIAFVNISADDNTPIRVKKRPQYEGRSLSDFEDSHNFITRTIFIKHNELNVGTVQVAVSQESITYIITTNTITSILGLLGLTIVIYITVLLITKRFVINQILLLKSSTDEISSGNLNAFIETGGSDEIGELAKSFDNMRTSIKDSIDKIRHADELSKVNLKLQEEISERIKAEEELKIYRDHLKELVDKRTIELEKRNEELKSAINELETFSYSISHDLKAPLRAIAGFSNILMEDHMGSLDKKGKRTLNIIQTNVTHMGELIEDILMYSRAGRNPLKKSSIPLKNLAEDVVTKIRQEFPGREIQIKIPSLPSCMCDRVLMYQVMTNLLNNAVKFTAKQEVAEIELGSTKVKDETVYFVRDNGVGFNMKYADKLFGLFQRLHSSKEFEGTGVGLAIVQRLIQRHGGRVWAEGTVNEGATFYFTL